MKKVIILTGITIMLSGCFGQDIKTPKKVVKELELTGLMLNKDKVKGVWEDRMVTLKKEEHGDYSNNTEEKIDKNHSVYIELKRPYWMPDESSKIRMSFIQYDYFSHTKNTYSYDAASENKKQNTYKAYQVFTDKELTLAIDKDKNFVEAEGIYRENTYYVHVIPDKSAFLMQFLSKKCDKKNETCVIKYKVYNFHAKSLRQLEEAYKNKVGNYNFKGFTKKEEW